MLGSGCILWRAALRYYTFNFFFFLSLGQKPLGLTESCSMLHDLVTASHSVSSVHSVTLSVRYLKLRVNLLHVKINTS